MGSRLQAQALELKQFSMDFYPLLLLESSCPHTSRENSAGLSPRSPWRRNEAPISKIYLVSQEPKTMNSFQPLSQSQGH